MGDNTVRFFNPSDDPFADDDYVMPQLQECLRDNDSSSDGSDVFSDDLDVPLLPSVPAPTSQNVILNINQLPSIDASSNTSHSPFEQNLKYMLNM